MAKWSLWYYYFICWIVKEGKIHLIYCSTEDIAADIFTKALLLLKVKYFAHQLGLDMVWEKV